MRGFVKLGGSYFRPENIVSFTPNGMNSDKTHVLMADGTEWNIYLTVDKIAAILDNYYAENYK